MDRRAPGARPRACVRGTTRRRRGRLRARGPRARRLSGGLRRASRRAARPLRGRSTMSSASGCSSSAITITPATSPSNSDQACASPDPRVVLRKLEAISMCGTPAARRNARLPTRTRRPSSVPSIPWPGCSWTLCWERELQARLGRGAHERFAEDVGGHAVDRRREPQCPCGAHWSRLADKHAARIRTLSPLRGVESADDS